MLEVKSQIVVGRMGGAHGVKGWMKIMSYTRPKENIFNYSPWLIHVDGTWREIEIEESQQRGERLLVKMMQINNPEDASLYKNCDIAINREQLPELEEGKYYWHDLIGLNVFNQDEIYLGKIVQIEETGANDVLVISKQDKSKKNILIPLIMDIYVQKVDLDADNMHVDWQLEE